MWEINLTAQLTDILYAMLLGGVLCLLCDVFRGIRTVNGGSVTAIFFQDVILWVVAAVCSFCLFSARCNGEIRGYMLVFMGVGFTLIRFTVSKFFFCLFKWFFGSLKSFSERCVDFFERIGERLRYFSGTIRLYQAKKRKKCCDSCKKLLKRGYQLLYTKQK